MKKSFFTILLLVGGFILKGQNYSERMSASIMHTHSDSITVKVGKPAGWDYEQGLLLKALEKMYQRTGDAKYFNYIKKNIDSFVDEQGNIRTYHFNEFNSDNITTGRMLLYLYQELGDVRYKKAADKLRAQIAAQPRDADGDFGISNVTRIKCGWTACICWSPSMPNIRPSREKITGQILSSNLN